MLKKTWVSALFCPYPLVGSLDHTGQKKSSQPDVSFRRYARKTDPLLFAWVGVIKQTRPSLLWRPNPATYSNLETIVWYLVFFAIFQKTTVILSFIRNLLPSDFLAKYLCRLNCWLLVCSSKSLVETKFYNQIRAKQFLLHFLL